MMKWKCLSSKWVLSSFQRQNQLSSPHVSFFSAPRNITDIPLARRHAALAFRRSGDHGSKGCHGGHQGSVGGWDQRMDRDGQHFPFFLSSSVQFRCWNFRDEWWIQDGTWTFPRLKLHKLGVTEMLRWLLGRKRAVKSMLDLFVWEMSSSSSVRAKETWETMLVVESCVFVHCWWGLYMFVPVFGSERWVHKRNHVVMLVKPHILDILLIGYSNTCWFSSWYSTPHTVDPPAAGWVIYLDL